jgi:hypothetical protein
MSKIDSLYGVHKSGVAFSMRLLVHERRKENGERQFIGMVQKTNENTQTGVVIISEVGIIKMVTQQTLKMFGGYYASDLVGKVIFTLFL